MQALKLTTLLATLVLAGGTLMAPEAKAYDPCQRAIEDMQEAERLFHRWRRNNCPSNGQCSNPERGVMLLNRYYAARDRVSRYCN